MIRTQDAPTNQALPYAHTPHLVLVAMVPNNTATTTIILLQVVLLKYYGGLFYIEPTVHTKICIFRYFYSQYLVLFTMAHRNSNIITGGHINSDQASPVA